jgi:ubiquitin-like modifier-activating enzyme 5
MEHARYQRLKAIQTFGYDIQWEDLQQKSCVIAGVGGLGMVTAEMLVRCGIGMLHLFDKDTVEVENLNRMGFLPEDIGKKKVEVITSQLHKINPDVKIKAYHGDILDWGMDETFETAVRQADIVLMGVDNYPARMFVNQKCLNLQKVLIDAGVARSALSGNVHPIIPGKTACMMCTARFHGKNEQVERGEACTASLPTTMALIAALQVQETLKYLLNFGELADYLSYNALTGETIAYQTQRDPQCDACASESLPNTKV